jgi:hypothetical protein
MADEKTGIVEMAWDPITRVIGSLGIHTKIDFGGDANRLYVSAPRPAVTSPPLRSRPTGRRISDCRPIR